MSDTVQRMNQSHTETGLSLTAVAGTGATVMHYLPDMLATMASLFTILWLGLQITIAIQNQVDRRRRRRLQAVQDVHTMQRADAMTQAILEKPVIPVVVVPAGPEK